MIWPRANHGLIKFYSFIFAFCGTKELTDISP